MNNIQSKTGFRDLFWFGGFWFEFFCLFGNFFCSCLFGFVCVCDLGFFWLKMVYVTPWGTSHELNPKD